MSEYLKASINFSVVEFHGKIQLDLFGVGINDENVQDVCKFLDENSNIQVINVNHNKDFTSVGLAVLVGNLKGIERVSCNSCSIEDASSLGEVLNCNEQLKEVYLSNNKVTDKDAASILGASHLTRIRLDRNKGITTVGSIGEKIEVLELRENSIGDDGASNIFAFLKQNDTLRYLDLRMNKISENLKMQLLSMERRKKNGTGGGAQVKTMVIKVDDDDERPGPFENQ